MSTKTTTDWTLANLQEHLKYAIDLEFWTIPFYRTAYHALPSDQADAQSAVKGVSIQEMFHCQCAWNIAQAFGVDYDFAKRSFDYSGQTIPHLDFALESPNPATEAVTINGTSYDFTDYSATLNPSSFDQRINAMCLVEYPDWQKPDTQELKPNITEYPSIGHFYAAIQTLMQEGMAFSNGDLVVDSLTANTATQTNIFGSPLPTGFDYTITKSGADGLAQVNALIDAIVEEGEGTSSADSNVPADVRYDGDEDAHFDTFLSVKSGGSITQNTMNADGVSNINAGLITFLPAVNTLFTGGGADSGTFFTAMYAFDDVIVGAFTS